jgi:hypothetical protein
LERKNEKNAPFLQKEGVFGQPLPGKITGEPIPD